jgi:hypothetical protein
MQSSFFSGRFYLWRGGGVGAKRRVESGGRGTWEKGRDRRTDCQNRGHSVEISSGEIYLCNCVKLRKFTQVIMCK